MLFFLAWRFCRHVAGASLPKNVQLLWNARQVREKLPSCFTFDWNTLGIFYEEAAALYDEKITKFMRTEPAAKDNSSCVMAEAEVTQIRMLGEGLEMEVVQTTYGKVSVGPLSEGAIAAKSDTKEPSQTETGSTESGMSSCGEEIPLNAGAKISSPKKSAGGPGDVVDEMMGSQSTKKFRCRHAILATGAFSGQLMNKIKVNDKALFSTDRFATTVQTFTCPDLRKQGETAASLKMTVEDKCPIFSFPEARICGFPQKGEGAETPVAIRPTFAGTTGTSSRDMKVSAENLDAVHSFVEKKMPSWDIKHTEQENAITTRRYSQLAVDPESGPSSVVDFVPSTNDRIILATVSYGFKYGAIYGLEILELLNGFGAPKGLEWNKRVTESFLLRVLHAAMDILLRETPGKKDSALPTWVLAALVTALVSVLSAERTLQVLFFFNCAIYSFGSEWLRPSVNLKNACVVWSIHFAAVLGLTSVILAAIYLSGLALPGKSHSLRLACLTFAVILNAVATRGRFLAMMHCGFYTQRCEVHGSGTMFSEKPDEITKTGLYALMRHPGFAAHILQWSATAVFFSALCGSGLVECIIVVAFVFAAGWAIFDRSCAAEESELEGDAYALYKVDVPRRFDIEAMLFEVYVDVIQRTPLWDWTRKVREGNARQGFVKMLGLLQGIKVGYVDPRTDPLLIEQVLMSSDKGKFIEDLLACPSWWPIRSVESVNARDAVYMRKIFTVVADNLKCVERAPQIAEEVLSSYKLRNEQGEVRLLTSGAIAAVTAKCFFQMITDRLPTEEELGLILSAVTEWKGILALKRGVNKNSTLRVDLVTLMRKEIKASPWFNENAGQKDAPFKCKFAPFDPDNIDDLSSILQPMLISPIINVPDIFSALRVLLTKHPEWVAKGAASEHVSECMLLETIRMQHPFPILERVVTKPILTSQGEQFAPGTQVFVEYDQATTTDDFDPMRWEDEYNCPYRAIPFGAGPRRCAGKTIARGLIKKMIHFFLKEYGSSIVTDTEDNVNSAADMHPAADVSQAGCPVAGSMDASKCPASQLAVKKEWDNYNAQALRCPMEALWKPQASTDLFAEAFRPDIGHALSGRNNDDEEVDLGNMLLRLGGCVVESFKIGFQVRLGFGGPDAAVVKKAAGLAKKSQ
jgi:protein-S-isoprenylcysteine O-methyltransferase Ste14